jgi:hypothetical protein
MLLKEQSEKRIYRDRMVKCHGEAMITMADLEHLRREVAEHNRINICAAAENASLKRKLEEAQTQVTDLLHKDSVVPKAGCSILPGATAPKLCVFKF